MSERVVSPGDLDAERDRPLLAWTVRWVLSVGTQKARKGARLNIDVMATARTSEGKTFVLYRRQMLALLRFPKPAFDQLAIELPMLMAFRSAEVATWRAEYIYFQTMDTLVLDAKKKQLLLVPMQPQVARHTEQVLNGRSRGLVLRSRSNAQQDPDRPLRTESIWQIWHKWNRLVGLPNGLHISPIDGRRFFAAEWYHRKKKPLISLQKVMRHKNPLTTLQYVQSLIFYEDVKRDYEEFQMELMQEVLAPNVT